MNAQTSHGGWQKIDDPVLHKRITAAVTSILDHVDPHAIRAETTPDGSGFRDVLFAGAADYSRSVYQGTGPHDVSPFSRTDYWRKSNERESSRVAADSDGRTVLFDDDLTPGTSVEEAVTALEEFARRVAAEAGQ